MGVKSTTFLTREQAIDEIVRNIVNITVEDIEFEEKLRLKKLSNTELEDILEEQAEHNGNHFDNFSIVKEN